MTSLVPILLLLYSSQLPPLGPSLPGTIQVPDTLSHWVGLGEERDADEGIQKSPLVRMVPILIGRTPVSQSS